MYDKREKRLAAGDEPPPDCRIGKMRAKKKMRASVAAGGSVLAAGLDFRGPSRVPARRKTAPARTLQAGGAMPVRPMLYGGGQLVAAAIAGAADAALPARPAGADLAVAGGFVFPALVLPPPGLAGDVPATFDAAPFGAGLLVGESVDPRVAELEAQLRASKMREAASAARCEELEKKREQMVELLG